MYENDKEIFAGLLFIILCAFIVWLCLEPLWALSITGTLAGLIGAAALVTWILPLIGRFILSIIAKIKAAGGQ